MGSPRYFLACRLNTLISHLCLHMSFFPVFTWASKSSSSYKDTSCQESKSLQSCPTLCDPIDSSPPSSPVPEILQARTLEWVAISFSNAWKWKVKVKSLSRIRLFATPWTAAYQAPPSMGFSRQEYYLALISTTVMYLSQSPLLLDWGHNGPMDLSRSNVCYLWVESVKVFLWPSHSLPWWPRRLCVLEAVCSKAVRKDTSQVRGR